MISPFLHPLIFHSSAEDLARNLAEEIRQNLQESMKTTGHAFLVLPGGTSPQALLRTLARTELPWENVIITTTDERCVPVTDPTSNTGQIVRIFAEERVQVTPICLWANGRPNQKALETLPWPPEVCVVGMGLDGHIASLFPGASCVSGPGMIMYSMAPSEPRNRVSMTLDALTKARHLILLVAGEEKWNLCREVLKGGHQDLPLARFLEAGRAIDLHILPKS
jgi:6-phosphogluconolactonase